MAVLFLCILPGSGAWWWRTPRRGRLPRTYIHCRGFPHPGFDRYARTASQDPCWRLLHPDSSHLPYITSPHELAPMLLELAAS